MIIFFLGEKEVPGNLFPDEGDGSEEKEIYHVAIKPVFPSAFWYLLAF